MSLYLKDPAASLDYTIDWGAGYLGFERIAASSWTIEPAGELSIVSSSANETLTTVTLAGGVSGTVYRVTNHVVLTDAREDERALMLRVEQR